MLCRNTFGSCSNSALIILPKSNMADLMIRFAVPYIVHKYRARFSAIRLKYFFLVWESCAALVLVPPLNSPMSSLPPLLFEPRKDNELGCWKTPVPPGVKLPLGMSPYFGDKQRRKTWREAAKTRVRNHRVIKNKRCLQKFYGKRDFREKKERV